MKLHTFMCVLIVLTQQYTLTFCLKYDRSRRQLDTIPNDIPEDAVEVILSSNSITRLEPNTFSRLSQCTHLDLNYNHISETEPGAFNGLIALTYLSLGHNRLDQLSVNMFSGLVALEKLYLHLNSISSIEDKTFSNLQKLKRLDLHYNSLEPLRSEMFRGLESLRYMHLGGNRLTALPADVFSYLPRPLELKLSNPRANLASQNVLNCDFKLCWLKLEELKGTIKWTSNDFKPRCADGVEWETWRCEETTSTSISTTVTSGENTEDPEENNKDTEVTTESVTSTTTTKAESNDNLKWILIAVGIVLIIIITTTILVMLCWHRCGVRLCHNTAPKEENKTAVQPGNNRNLELGFTNRSVSMTTEDSGYIPPVNQWQGYTEVVDYPDSIYSVSTFTTPADSTAAEYGSGYIRSRNPSREYTYVLDPDRGSPN